MVESEGACSAGSRARPSWTLSARPRRRGTAFVLLFDAPTDAGLERAHEARLALLAQNCSRVLGFTPRVVWAPLPPLNYRGGPEELTTGLGAVLGQRLDALAREGHGPAFVLPVSFDFGLDSKQWLTQVVREQQRRCPELLVHYDAQSLTHPLLVQCFVDSACRALGELKVSSPNDLGLLLVANGAADAETRADSYKLMRLVLGAAGR